MWAHRGLHDVGLDGVAEAAASRARQSHSDTAQYILPVVVHMKHTKRRLNDCKRPWLARAGSDAAASPRRGLG